MGRQTSAENSLSLHRHLRRINPMAWTKAQKIRATICDEPWSQGRYTVVNELSNTISVVPTCFESYSKNPVLAYMPQSIPLTFRGVPVIPSFCIKEIDGANAMEAHESLILWPLRGQHPICNGFSQEQLDLLQQVFGGIISADFFFDRQVIISVDDRWHDALCPYSEISAFRAWGCEFHLVFQMSMHTRRGGDTPSLSILGSPPLQPGTLFSNLHTQSLSAVGIYLCRKSGEGALREPSYFTVSSQFFVINDYSIFKALKIYGVPPITLAVLWEALVSSSEISDILKKSPSIINCLVQLVVLHFMVVIQGHLSYGRKRILSTWV